MHLAPPHKPPSLSQTVLMPMAPPTHAHPCQHAPTRMDAYPCAKAFSMPGGVGHQLGCDRGRWGGSRKWATLDERMGMVQVQIFKPPHCLGYSQTPHKNPLRLWSGCRYQNTTPHPYLSIPLARNTWCYPYPCHSLPVGETIDPMNLME